jgi:hypothetical protein
MADEEFHLSELDDEERVEQLLDDHVATLLAGRPQTSGAADTPVWRVRTLPTTPPTAIRTAVPALTVCGTGRNERSEHE